MSGIGDRYSSSSSSSPSRDPPPDLGDDRYDIYDRFCVTHAQYHALALAELEAGRKTSHWSWYIFPTPPFVVNGRERGSGTNKHYALRDKPRGHTGLKAAQAFLSFPPCEVRGKRVNLRANYQEIMAMVAKQLEPGGKARSAAHLVGRVDEPKLKSSLKLFLAASAGGFDDATNELCARALAAMEPNKL